MTEDEAFIRAVVNAPGDDLPRLVYADWLDERKDRRGSYLRTELELVHNDDWGGLQALRHSLVVIAEFDLIWAARVSRPPAGVCCDHLRFTNRGPTLEISDIAGVELKVGVRLPDDLRAFLLNYNAGSLTPLEPVPDHLPQAECHPALYFYPIGHDYETPFEAVGTLDAMLPYRLAAGYAVIAYNALEMRHHFLRLDSEDEGAVVSDCVVRPELGHSGNPLWSSPNLSRFLAELSPTWVMARTHQHDI